MAKDPAHRFSTAGDLASAARAALKGTAVLPEAPLRRPEPVQKPLAPPPRGRTSRGVLVGVAAAAVVTMAGALAVALVATDRISGGTALPAGPGAVPSTAGATPGASAEATPGSLGGAPPPAQATTTVTVPAPLAQPQPVAPAPAPVVEAPGATAPFGDLGLPRGIVSVPCTGGYAVFVGAAVDPASYATRVQELLDANPGSNYLLSGANCSSLRARDGAGNDIYGVFYGPFASQAEACSNRAAVGGDSYVKVLDDVTAPSVILEC